MSYADIAVIFVFLALQCVTTVFYIRLLNIARERGGLLPKVPRPKLWQSVQPNKKLRAIVPSDPEYFGVDKDRGER